MDLTDAQLFAMGRELVETTRDWTADGVLEIHTNRMSSLAHGPIVHAFARHCLLAGSAALDLHEQHNNLAAMPLSRSAWEFGITAMWASNSREAAAAVHEQNRRQQRRLLQSMQSWPGIETDVPGRIDEIYGSNLDTSVTHQAQNFEQRCLALSGIGEQAYSIFRAMSAYCHPSSLLIDQYLEATEMEPGVRLRQQPTQLNDSPWAYLTLISMVWGARAFDVMTIDHAHRNYLRRLARELGMGVDIAQLTPEAQMQEDAARQARKRAEWKPKRRRRQSASDDQ